MKVNNGRQTAVGLTLREKPCVIHRHEPAECQSWPENGDEQKNLGSYRNSTPPPSIPRK
jgi:hypothetical protein